MISANDGNYSQDTIDVQYFACDVCCLSMAFDILEGLLNSIMLSVWHSIMLNVCDQNM